MKILSYIRKYCYRGSLGLGLLMVLSMVSIVVALGINFWALGRTFITSDEGWYMYLFSTSEVHSASHAHLLLG